MRVTYRANRMAVNARGAVSEVPSVLSSLLFVGNRNRESGSKTPGMPRGAASDIPGVLLFPIPYSRFPTNGL